MRISQDCINQDHRALGSHTIDCIPLNEACRYPTDLVWAESTGQPSQLVVDLRKDDEAHTEDP